MMAKMGSVHEAEAELLSAEDAIQDAARLRALFRQRRQGERAVPVRVPLWTLLEAIDHLEPDELRQAVERAEKRLAAIRG
jgi:cellobiose-specific phosphotransferase system component IIA